jgi:preflagellin peptidase FlaK
VDGFAITRLGVGGAFLLVAAMSDVRTRTVPDRLWIGLGSVGLVVLAVQIVQDRIEPDAWALLGSSAILFFVIFFGAPFFEEDGFHARPLRFLSFLSAAALFVYPAVEHSASGTPMSQPLVELYSMPAMVLVYQVFYRVRILHGGADAKALIALGLLIPTYPNMSPLPLIAPDPRVETFWRVAFPFSLVVWVDAAVLFLAIPVSLLVFNAIRGDFGFPQALLGYRARLDSFPAHAWLMEKIDARGQHVLVLFPKRGGDPAQDLARLRDAGIKRAWVTPQVPFMVPLLGGLFLAFVVGNVLLGFLGWIG